MRTRLTKCLAATALSAALVMGLVMGIVTPAQADTPQQPTSDIHQLLATYPGAVQVSAHTVRAQPGVLVSSPLEEQSSQTLRGGFDEHNCYTGDLCLWSEPNFQGWKATFYYCQFYDLGSIDFPGPGNYKWNDKTSSIDNNQTGYGWSYFYNWDGMHDWVSVMNLYYTDKVADLNSYSLNDIIDAVRVC